MQGPPTTSDALPASHREAQRLAERADVARRDADVDAAKALYAQAAQLEAEVLGGIPQDKRRTIGIIGVSVASLWYDAGEYSNAGETARRLLARGDLLPSARSALTEILNAIEQASGAAVPSTRIEPSPAPPLPGISLVQELDQHDRELLGALQAEIPLISTPYAFIGQTLDLSEKEVIKRTERLRRDGFIRHLAAQFDARALGYRSCLVAARVDPERIDDAAAVINAHPGVTQNYRRNNELNLWFTIFISPFSKIGLEKTVEILGRAAECDSVRPLPTLKVYKNAATDGDGSSEHESHGGYTPLTPLEVECVRLLQSDLPLQPRPFDFIARVSGIGVDELLTSARTLLKRGQIRRFAATVAARKQGFAASAMGVWVVPQDSADEYAAKFVQHRAVSHCYLRPVYDDWPYNLYSTVHASSVDECESIINDLAIETGLSQRQTLYPTKEYKKARVRFFSPEAEEWEAEHGGEAVQMRLA